MERLPGFRDFFPRPLPQKNQWEFEARLHLFAAWRRVLAVYGFKEYDGPPVEPLELFTKKSGREIVGQLYNFDDKGGRAVALRPEMTPTLARMVATHERQYKKPIKWFSIPQLFRYERQQKGRLREHFQLNADIVGEAGVEADAELIALLIDVLRALGLGSDDFVIHLSSREAWQAFFREHGGSGTDEYEFFQIVDKLERTPEETAAVKLDKIGVPLEAVRRFITEGELTSQLKIVLKNLRARGIDQFVKIDYGVIRGLAYYTGIVFEAFDRRGEFRAIAGGGRYDKLVELISDAKTDLPALGFGMGDVVLLELLRSRDLLPKGASSVDVYCLIEDEALRSDSLNLIQGLRDAGFRVDYSLVALKSNKQFCQAMDMGASFTATLVPGEQLTVRLKSLADRKEETVAVVDCVAVLKRRLAESHGD
ncbi:MAG: Histidine--tRNA ligase [Verrucomicrobia subdivision 3 bacterium]|nr:Histidine--tRNA ligase [Limisphaerales bacterium]MCS1414164.1 Histidine--tRNA ligase [Limisphaerales bacterium]